MPFRASSESEDNFVWDRETYMYKYYTKGGLQRKNVPHMCTLSTMVFFAHFDNLNGLELALLLHIVQNYRDWGLCCFVHMTHINIYDTFFWECVRCPTFYQNQKLRRKSKNGPQSRQSMTWHWSAFVVLPTFVQKVIFEHPFKGHTYSQRTFYAIVYLAFFLSLPFVVE